MKTSQALATALWLFPLTSLATSSAPSSTPTSTAQDVWPSHLSQPSDKDAALWKPLGCFKAPASKNPAEDDSVNPLGADTASGMVSPSRQFNSIGFCTVVFGCTGFEYAAVMQGDNCYCASALHEELESVDDENCNVPCKGWAQETCGGNGYLQVYENTDPDLHKPKTTITDKVSTSTVPPSGSSTAPVEETTSGGAAPAETSTVPAGAGSNGVARGVAWLAAGAGVAFLL